MFILYILFSYLVLTCTCHFIFVEPIAIKSMMRTQLFHSERLFAQIYSYMVCSVHQRINGFHPILFSQFQLHLLLRHTL